jgi:hypothetical protein
MGWNKNSKATLLLRLLNLFPHLFKKRLLLKVFILKIPSSQVRDEAKRV